MLLAEVGAEGLESVATLRSLSSLLPRAEPQLDKGQHYGHDTCRSSCPGTLSHRLTLHLKQAPVSFCPTTVCLEGLAHISSPIDILSELF